MLVQLPSSQVANVVGKVLLTSMSTVRNDRPKFVRLFLMTVGIYAAALSAIALAVAAAAPAVIRVLLGDGWDEAIEVLPLVAAGSALALAAQPLGTAAEAVGALRAKLLITLFQVFVGVAGIIYCVTTDRGLLGFSTAWVTSEFARWCAYQGFSRKVLNIPMQHLLRPYLEALLLSGLLAAPLYVATRVFALNDFVALLSGGFTGLVLVGGVWVVGRRRFELNETVEAILRLRKQETADV